MQPNKLRRLVPEFVTSVPAPLEAGILYISIPFTAAIHLCCCGCGFEVVTAFAPRTGWSMTFDGETVSLDPSVGNRQLPCRSHYLVKRNRIVWCDPFEDEIEGTNTTPKMPEREDTVEDLQPNNILGRISKAIRKTGKRKKRKS